MEKKRQLAVVNKEKQHEADKVVTEKQEQQGAVDSKEEKQRFMVKNKRQILNILRENETYKAMKKRTRKNLFDPRYEYKLGEEGFNREHDKWGDQMN